MFVVTHISVGFCVARSTEMGNAKASSSGTSNSTDSHAFCIIYFNHTICESQVAKLVMTPSLLLGKSTELFGHIIVCNKDCDGSALGTQRPWVS
jgi:hypothetical protein